jgi:methylated-DNA-[protein]-cysteine S-methyltransferase
MDRIGGAIGIEIEVEGLPCAWAASRWGDLGIVWRGAGTGLRVRRILLPNECDWARDLVETFPPDLGLPPPVAELSRRMGRYLNGEAVAFEQQHLDLLALSDCSPFQRRVLLAEFRIPRGSVSTYGRIAAHLGIPGGARAVGNGLARNPFPIVIPCHRAVRSDGGLGGFRGGLPMKRALLEMEGVAISPADRVCVDQFYY